MHALYFRGETNLALDKDILKGKRTLSKDSDYKYASKFHFKAKRFKDVVKQGKIFVSTPASWLTAKLRLGTRRLQHRMQGVVTQQTNQRQ